MFKDTKLLGKVTPLEEADVIAESRADSSAHALNPTALMRMSSEYLLRVYCVPSTTLSVLLDPLQIH